MQAYRQKAEFDRGRWNSISRAKKPSDTIGRVMSKAEPAGDSEETIERFGPSLVNDSSES